jgi:hypothetical protein
MIYHLSRLWFSNYTPKPPLSIYNIADTKLTQRVEISTMYRKLLCQNHLCNKAYERLRRLLTKSVSDWNIYNTRLFKVLLCSQFLNLQTQTSDLLQLNLYKQIISYGPWLLSSKKLLEWYQVLADELGTRKKDTREVVWLLRVEWGWLYYWELLRRESS